ncbi:MAG TPA: hypothetical protein VFR09_02685 [Alphaproteobacteria bacterium]|nr:hypothetical protein [Alphaproteobacteria bacterium]
MWNWLEIELVATSDLIKSGFAYIFPEYPYAGILITTLCVLLMLFYTMKAGVYQGMKIGASIWFILVMVLFCVHHMALLFTHG